MSAALRHWVATDSDTQGVELVAEPIQSQNVFSAVSAAVDVSDLDAAYLLVPLATASREGVSLATREAGALGSETRICFLIDAQTLAAIDSETPDCNVGFVLDNVDATTSLNHLLSHRIDAIRLDEGFVLEASPNLRTRAVLNAILALANDLALATLGPAGNLAEVVAAGCFDYMPYISGPGSAATDLQASLSLA